MTEYRVENKYIVSEQDIAIITHRLKGLMREDVHHKNGYYEIRSIYFDDMYDSCMHDNENGINCRRKYRIRTYGSDKTLMKFEIKQKKNGFTKKDVCLINENEYYALMNGGEQLEFEERRPLNELLLQIKCNFMRPKTVVVYERTAYTCPTGNVRITFDKNIMAGKDCEHFLEKHIYGCIPVLPKGMHVMEVKYDEFLPDIIARQLEAVKRKKVTFSKYYLGRMAVNGEVYEDVIS